MKGYKHTDKKKLIDHLNEDLACELSAIIQYLTYAAKATGPYRPQLSQLFLAEVGDEQLHAQFLANKIGALPKVHFSSQAEGGRTGNHAEQVNPNEFREWLTRWSKIGNFDLMLEAKGKDQALQALMEKE